jgi:hypothetical protein
LENKKLFSISIIILAASIIFGSVWIGNSLEKAALLEKSVPTAVESKVLNLKQAAEYLNMSEEDILGIIRVEKTILENTHMFSGRMFPYFKVNDKQYFDKNQMDEWLKEASINRREYNTAKGWIN